MNPSRLAFTLASAAASALVTPAALAAEIDPARIPPAATREISFPADIQPIFDKACLRCHGAVKPKGGYRIDNRESALKGGDEGVAIVPGDSAKSPLIHYVARLVPDMEMPPTGKVDPLTPEEVGLLRAWIDQGARWGDAGTTGPRFDATVTPAIQFVSIRGNAARFREHTGIREGWGGGLDQFSIHYDTDPQTHVTLDGRVMYGPDDYRIATRVTRDQVGWLRFDYREFSRYDDDTGGYQPTFGLSAPRLGEDLVVRNRHATFEAGLELPDLPRIRLAYDLHLRDGTESTLNWGSWTENGVARGIYPGRKRLDEQTHLITLDLDYDWNGLLISNESQFEWHDQDNRRTQFELANGPFEYATRVTDQQDSWRGANVLRLERSLRDWLYVSGGYLYSNLKDLGGFSVESFVPNDPSVPPTLDRSADDLVLRRQSNVINGNVMLGPWEHLHFFTGLQAEWTRQEGLATGQNFGQTARYDASVDRAATDQNFGLRYAGLPSTVLYAETRFQQETFSHYEEGYADANREFLRDTDAEGDTKSYEAGFTVSPWTSASFGAKYRHRDRLNHYDHPRDVDMFGSANGYPAFILDRDSAADEVETRLVLQPLRWLKTTLKYGYSTSDFETRTASWEDIGQVPPVTYAGGRLTSGTYDAHQVSAGFGVTPWQRLHLSTTVGWTTSISQSGINNGQESVPYEGDTWNVLSMATFVFDEKTDIIASHLFSNADFEQDNADFTLPLGMAYTRHAATAGITRRLKKDRVLRLEYGFFNYDEPTLGGAADYTAHALFASLRIPWK